MKVTLGYIPDRCAENSIVQINKMSITYSQPADTNSERDAEQFITIEAENCGSGEDGWYYSVKIDTKWSIDDPEQIADIIRDFKKRMEFEITKEADIKTFNNKEQST